METKNNEDLDITVGIITTIGREHILEQVIDSIEINNMPVYEIIIVGDVNVHRKNTTVIKFDETIKPNWITKKKNIIAQNAKYNILVILHDYVSFDKDWYEGMKKFGSNFDTLCNKVVQPNGERFRDHVFYRWHLPDKFKNRCLIPHDYITPTKLNKFRYHSGSCYIVKKEIALSFPLNEDLCWGQSEDVEWCSRLSANNIMLLFNPYSTFVFLKYKPPVPWDIEMSSEEIKELEEMF